MEVHAVEALTDNYMYLIVDTATREAAAIDPADAPEMIAAASKLDARITQVLTTHHHFDHAGGNNDMKRLLPDVVIVGGERDKVQGMTKAVNDGDKLQIGSGLTVTCIHTPCHTAGHMAFLVAAAAGPAAVFTGDVLFVGGCGRFFEGGPEDMCGALAKLARLPPDTKVYCGHEYTIKNFDFAWDVEPQNDALRSKIEWAHTTRKKGGFTIPSCIADELATNPFMRVAHESVRGYCDGSTTDVDTMRILRNKKDKFVGSSRPWIPGGGPLPGL